MDLPIVPCACCGYLTVTDNYDICEVCGWEQDSLQVADPDSCGANDATTLRMAQKNFEAFGACDEHALKFRHGVLPAHKRDPLWKPLPVK